MTDKKQDGGPAYPQHRVTLREDGVTIDEAVTGGMSLRDWFAGQVLMGHFASGGHMSGGSLSSNGRSEVARNCYMAADAMLKARGK